MDNQTLDLFWSLLAKKLSKDASPEELQELHSILLNNPNLHHHADMLCEMWQQDTQIIGGISEAAYMRHVMKHKDELFTEEHTEETTIAEPVFEERPGFFQSLRSKRRLTIFSFTALLILAAGSFYFFTGKKNNNAH